MVLENDQFFAFTGPTNRATSTKGVGDVAAEVLVQGQGGSSNPAFFVAAGRRYSAELNGLAQFDANYVAGTSISGKVYASGYPNVTYSGTKPTFSATRGLGYTYEAPADLRLFGTTWLGGGVDNNLTSSGAQSSGATIAISSAGNLTTRLGPCAITGTLVPRASGKNVFDVTLTYSPGTAGTTSCPNKSVKGIAVWFLSSVASAQLLIGATTADGSSAIVLSGIR